MMNLDSWKPTRWQKLHWRMERRFKDAFNFRYHFRRVKWFYQRGRRGWADCDWWGMDDYLVGIILPMLKQLKEYEHGYPGYGKASTPEKWDKLLDEMIEGFEAAKRITDDNYNLTTYLVDFEADRKLFEKKARIFIKWFFHLWD